MLGLVLMMSLLSPVHADDDPPYDEPKNSVMDFTVGTGIISLQPIWQHGSNGESVINGKLTFLDSGRDFQWRGVLDVSVPTEALQKRELRSIDVLVGGKWRVTGKEVFIRQKDEYENNHPSFSRLSIGFDILYSEENHKDNRLWDTDVKKEDEEGLPHTFETDLGNVNQTLLGALAYVGFTGVQLGDGYYNEKPSAQTWEVSIKGGYGKMNFESLDAANTVHNEVTGGLVQVRTDWTDFDDGTGLYAQYTGFVNGKNESGGLYGMNRFLIGGFFNFWRVILGAGGEFIHTNLGSTGSGKIPCAITDVDRGFLSVGFIVF